MYQEELNKLYWGFFFIMIDFRLQGFDILPDIVGYIFFASGLALLAASSEFFNKARSLNIPMAILSILSIYERPAQGGGIQLGTFGIFGVLIGIASIILNLLVIYNIFMGIKDIANQQEQMDLGMEADERWRQYLILSLAGLFAFVLIFVPALAFIYLIALLIAAILLTISIMGFIKRCSENL